jgi:cysteine desulfurase/selenocysteine lyase
LTQVVTSAAQQTSIENCRQDFPIFNQRLYDDKALVYLDSAATSQKPRQVIKALHDYYSLDNANVHRGMHALAHRATLAYEGAREKIRRFIGARYNREIIFTAGTTESINLLAQSWGQENINSGDIILLSEMEHHSNLIPWQMLAKKRGAKLAFVPVDEDGDLDIPAYRELLTEQVKLVAITHMSNVFGTITEAEEIVRLAHANNSLVLLDGAQAVAHMPVDVQELDVDFYAFSGHKMLAPTGIGVLYGKEEHLEAMPPYQGGGEMIHKVEYNDFTTASLPHKLEAGTPNISGAIGMGTAIDYLEALGMDEIHNYELKLTEYLLTAMSEIENIRIFGRPRHKGGVVAFNIDDVHPHDLSQLLDQQGVAIRAGHHCAQPLLRKLGQHATARVSVYLYNTKADIDAFVAAIRTCLPFLR